MLLDVLLAGFLAVVGSTGLAELATETASLNRLSVAYTLADNHLADLEARWRYQGIVAGTEPAPVDPCSGTTSPNLADWCARLADEARLEGASVCVGAAGEVGWTLVWGAAGCTAPGAMHRVRVFQW